MAHRPDIGSSPWRAAYLTPSSASSNSRAPPIRQPLNCNPCRLAKVKCDRGAPCGSCRRRQCVSACSYARKPRENRPSGPLPPSQGLSSNESLDQNMDVDSARDVDASRTRLGNLEPSSQRGQSQRIQTAHTASEYTQSAAGLAQMSPISNDEPGTVKENPAFANHDLTNERISSQFGPFGLDAGLQKAVSDQFATPSTDDSLNMSASANIGFPFEKGADFDLLLAPLPPKQQCSYLVSRYFSLFSPLFHILHRPTFESEYQAFVQNARSVEKPWLALLFILLALAITCLEDHDPLLNELGREADGPSNARNLAARYRSAAMRCLAADDFLARYDLTTLQALLLLIYAINHSQGAGQSWTLLGVALNIGIALRFHVDPDEFDLPALEAEQRRRAWAGLMMLHAVQASAFGLIHGRGLAAYQVRLPADVNDIDIKATRIDPAPNQPTEMSYMLYKFRLYQLSSDVCQLVMTPQRPTLEKIAYADAQISAEKATWNERYLRDGTANLLNCREQAHWNILHCYAHQLTLLLYRPFLDLTSTTDSGSFHSSPLARCAGAALGILDIHRLLDTSPSFRQYRWFVNGLGSFFALHGAVTLALCLSNRDFEDSGRARSSFDDAVGRFEQRQQQSNICAKALPVLNLLQSTLDSRESYATQGLGRPGDDDVGSGYDDVFNAWTQADKWTNPDSLPWDLWDSIIGREGGFL